MTLGLELVHRSVSPCRNCGRRYEHHEHYRKEEKCRAWVPVACPVEAVEQ